MTDEWYLLLPLPLILIIIMNILLLVLYPDHNPKNLLHQPRSSSCLGTNRINYQEFYEWIDFHLPNDSISKDFYYFQVAFIKGDKLFSVS